MRLSFLEMDSIDHVAHAAKWTAAHDNALKWPNTKFAILHPPAYLYPNNLQRNDLDEEMR